MASSQAHQVSNLWQSLPADLPEEFTETLIKHSGLRIERILSRGQHSAEGFWYEQAEHEWVLVLQGQASLEYADGRRVALAQGDHLLIPAGTRHRVAKTSRSPPVLWLAVFFSRPD